MPDKSPPHSPGARWFAAAWQTLAALAMVGGFALWAHLSGEAFYVTLATRIAILAIAGIGLNLALGLGGMVSFGHAAFFGLGGYAAGTAVHHAFEGSDVFTWPVTLPGSEALLTGIGAAIVVGLLAALLIGAFSLRTTGVYFIMITLAFAQMIYYFAISFPTYGGEDGLPLYVRATLAGHDITGEFDYFLVAFVTLVLVLIVTGTIMRSHFGAALNGIKESATRMQAIGIAPFRYRLIAFAISAGITAIAGALYVHLDGFVSPSNLSWHRSGELLVIVILGGVNRLAGPVFGAAALIGMETLLGDYTERWQFFLGLTLLGIVLFAKGGLSGLLDAIARLVRARRTGADEQEGGHD
jgi:branched-chain amino acid transport system permease protein